MVKQKKSFWFLYILFSCILTFSLYKVTAKQINYKEAEMQELDVRKLTDIKEVKENDNIELYNPPEVNEETPQEENTPYVPNDYWDYINQPLISVDFNTLKQKNNDTVAWIQLNGTNINYPVVQAQDNDYYLHQAFDGSYNLGGWVFMDYRNNPVEFDKNTIIYGHGMANNTIFGTLRYIVEYWWYSNPENHIVKLSTPYENTSWQIFSVYTIPEESYYIQKDFNSDEEYVGFLNTLKERSVYQFNASLNEQDKIITLSSCYNDQLRVVLHAKLIKREQR